MSDHTDELLLSKLREGNQSSFESIYHKYLPELFRFARKNTDNKEDAEELIQDVFVSLWERHHELNILSLRHYLFRAVRYKIIRYAQHEKVKRRYEEHYRFFEMAYDYTQENERQPEIIGKKIEAMLTQLPERCRYALHLRLSENLSNPEIAQRMNITKKTVETYMFTAFNLIRSHRTELLSAGLK
jgi:RNA polymerase sigma-70 factor (family 1)